MAIQQLSAPTLKQMIEDGARFEFVDVRTEAERELARIDGARLLDQTYYAELLAMDRDTVLVCHCHHGIRSQDAAWHFEQQGFRTIYNLSGGIDAWSQLVDPAVARY
jgi:monothiol glutaredoxin